MTETEQDARTRILAFAGHVGRDGGTGAEDVARRRNWLDAAGRPTEEGLELVEALSDQSRTRTVFRGNF
jgi:glutamate synthase domain-containing protein 2